jgi:YHS domain-containing protein
MNKRTFSPFFFGCWLLLFLLSCSSRAVPAINTTPDGIAIKGYDPVAYFTESRPVKGDESLQYQWQGATWLFSRKEHLEMFKLDPLRYAPRYGGYCAYAVSQGTTADIDPQSWNIVRGKLYLNLNKDVQNLWQQDRDNYINKADENWPHLISR